METCSVEGCERVRRARGVCSTHYARLRSGQDLTAPVKEAGGECAVQGCDRPRLFRNPDYCRLHYKRWHRTGEPGPAERVRRPDGEGTISNGYRMIRVGGRLVSEHRHVMAGIIGRPLLRDEHVHHLNGERADNRPENLELWCRPHPYGTRASDFVASIVERYPDEVRRALERLG